MQGCFVAMYAAADAVAPAATAVALGYDVRQKTENREDPPPDAIVVSVVTARPATAQRGS